MAVGDKREKLAHRLLIDHLSRVCSWKHLHSKKFAYYGSFAFFTCLPALYIRIILWKARKEEILFVLKVRKLLIIKFENSK